MNAWQYLHINHKYSSVLKGSRSKQSLIPWNHTLPSLDIFFFSALRNGVSAQESWRGVDLLLLL